MGHIKRGIVTSYINFISSAVVGLLITPVILAALGKSQYGVYSLVTSLISYLAALDFGFGNTITRYVAKFRAEGNKEKEASALATGFMINTAIAAVTAAVGAVIYFNLGKIFAKAAPDELVIMKKIFILALFNLALSFSFGSFASAMLAYEKFTVSNIRNFMQIIPRALVIVLLLKHGYGVVAMVMVDTALAILSVCFNVFYTVKILKLKFRLFYFDRSILKELTNYTVFVFIGIIVDKIYWKTDQIVIGIMRSMQEVGVYSVGQSIIQYYTGIASTFTGVFFAVVTGMVVKNISDEDLNRFFIMVSRKQFMLVGLILVGFVAFGREFIRLWVGTGYDAAYYCAIIIMVPFTIPLIQSLGLHILYAKKKHAFRSLMYLAIALFNVLLTVLFVGRFGIIGASVATAIALVIGNVIIINIYYKKVINLKVAEFFIKVVGRTSVALGAGAAASLPTYFLPIHGWGGLAFRCMLFTAVYGAVLYAVSLNDSEKRQVKGVLCKFGRFVLGQQST